MPATSAHFNGSVNLADTDTVFREICTRIPHESLTRLTDGETGERINWVFFQSTRFEATGQFVRDTPGEGPGADYGSTRRVRLADGVTPADVVWPDLGYAAAYTESFGTLRSLVADGIAPAGARLQLQYPTPLAGLSFLQPAEAQALLGSYTHAIADDLHRALDTLPHEKIAVQWDVAVEIGILAGQQTDPGTEQAIDYRVVTPALIACLAQVPEDVPVGMHLCYGDLGHRHFVQPESLGLQVGLINALCAASPRPIDWFALTVPQDRADESYFAPLQQLASPASTELAFGIVPYHPADQQPGVTARQIELIDRYLAASSAGARTWAISTECGMGRAAREDVPVLLDTYAEILAGAR